jgi:hypothetical protein
VSHREQHPEAHPEGRPWILGRRGAAREAPENTLASLRRAVELGLDGFSYDLRACASGELVLLHDPTLERTSDARGPLATRTLPELSGVDAGGWFEQRFAGEPLALFEEALEVEGRRAGAWPLHWIELQELGLAPALAKALAGSARRSDVRVASPSRPVCLEARDAGLAVLYVVREADDEAREFVRAEWLAGCAARGGGWSTAAGRKPWTCERWALGVEDPEELLDACRMGLDGVVTDEPRRALAVRELARAAPEIGFYPLWAPPLLVQPASAPGRGAEWCGSWELVARVQNPFDVPAAVGLDFAVRRGAFEAHGLRAPIDLEPGEDRDVHFELRGGSWSPGGDPLLVASFRWGEARRLVLDATLRRVREAVLGRTTLRLPLLVEEPHQAPASLSLRRRGRDLLLAIENAGGLDDAHLLVHLDGLYRRAGRGLRLRLPADFDRRPEGIAFSAGFEGLEPTPRGIERRVRRWAGGIPDELGSGAPGRLYSAGSA